MASRLHCVAGSSRIRPFEGLDATGQTLIDLNMHSQHCMTLKEGAHHNSCMFSAKLADAYSAKFS